MGTIGKIGISAVLLLGGMGLVIGTLKFFGVPENIVTFAAGFAAATIFRDLIGPIWKPKEPTND